MSNKSEQQPFGLTLEQIGQIRAQIEATDKQYDKTIMSSNNESSRLSFYDKLTKGIDILSSSSLADVFKIKSRDIQEKLSTKTTV